MVSADSAPLTIALCGGWFDGIHHLATAVVEPVRGSVGHAVFQLRLVHYLQALVVWGCRSGLGNLDYGGTVFRGGEYALAGCGGRVCRQHLCRGQASALVSGASSPGAGTGSGL
uniref:Uncharacterized protein n=1 Tax=Panagrolaimus superbus TaxID=310955 RepID=A0A914YBT8_9BILA